MLRQTVARKIPPPTWTSEDLNEPSQVAALWKGVETDTGHPLLVHFLARLIRVANVPARDPARYARALQLYSARRIKFFRERPERFQSAIRTVAWGIGDCDDKARFIAAALRTMRIPARLKILHITLPTGQRLGHVYPQFFHNGQWIALESVREYPMGYDPEARARQKGFGVSVSYVGDKGEENPYV